MTKPIYGTIHVEVEERPERGYIHSRVPVGTARVVKPGQILILLNQIRCNGQWHKLPAPFEATVQLASQPRPPSPPPQAVNRLAQSKVRIIDYRGPFWVANDHHRIWRELRLDGARWGLERCTDVAAGLWTEVLRTTRRVLLERTLTHYMDASAARELINGFTVGGMQ